MPARRRSISSFGGTPSVYIGIKATPGANPLDVIREVRKLMPELEWHWGYPMAIVLIVFAAILPLAYLKQKKIL